MPRLTLGRPEALSLFLQRSNWVFLAVLERDTPSALAQEKSACYELQAINFHLEKSPVRELWEREQTEFAAHTEFHLRGEQEFCAPPGAEQQRGPEHVANHGIGEKRQRRDVTMHETLQVVRIHAARRPHRKIRGGEEEQR